MKGLAALAIFLAIGFFTRFIDDTVGMGYGAFSATFLIGIGVVPALASASIHTAETFATLVSGVSHWGAIATPGSPSPGTRSRGRWWAW